MLEIFYFDVVFATAATVIIIVEWSARFYVREWTLCLKIFLVYSRILLISGKWERKRVQLKKIIVQVRRISSAQKTMHTHTFFFDAVCFFCFHLVNRYCLS